MTSKSTVISLQIKSIVIFQFLNTFNMMENMIIEVFRNKLKICSDELIFKKLHFYYGSKIGTYINPIEESTKITELKFDEEQEFKNLKLNEIIKLNKQLKIIEEFQKIELKSLNYSMISFDFQNSIIKLINMRNILSHKLIECSFKDKDIIEILSNNLIEENKYEFLTNYDISLMDDITKAIFSNFIYMEKIVELINSV